ncbi:chromosome segregation protein SMC [Vreelandella utahensis]|uniref:chromosome segregation protein SMC n=1 Tax=Vreelandella halophila TaxID=86177 RepID=UPI00098409AD|nr:chromosome segregation protein SMC [Halomonas utahensis]
MRLKSIKLAGFKSFVEPTTVPFPSNMTAVVGPNGCGKSNIIDAVRWVMGESSAKYLRGEAMSDVIFNGSTSRKPVGQASIELVFDNSDGTAPGEYGRFNEISVKRRVTREGQSDYFMNGAKCRRRDITDLFLGTGLGPRSYAIIEQGMISRLIEAKPEELRHYIEEAAGISRYKERRRETENRMRRTQENIDRLTDLRDELDRQLQHLEKQAEAAEKYRALKQEEREKQAELAVLRWRDLDASLQEHRRAIGEAETAQEKVVTERTSLESELESLRQEHSDRSERFNQAQGRYYEAGAEIARVEQNLKNQKRNARQAAEDLEQALASRREVAKELEQDQERLDSVTSELTTVEPELETASARAEEFGERLADAETRMQEWQQRWEDFSQRSADDRQQAEVGQSRIKASEDALLKLRERRQRLEEERATLDHDDRSGEEATLENEREEQQARVEEARERVETHTEQLERDREAIEQLEPELNEKRGRLQTLNGRLASEQALLEGQLGDSDERRREWLSQQGWEQAQRLAQTLEVSEGWEKAVEAVLGPLAQALVLNPDDYDGTVLTQAPSGLTIAHASGVGADAVPGTLLAEVGRGGSVAGWLARVWCAGDLNDVLARRGSLADGESLVTPGGIWVGPEWLRLPDEGDDDTGVIERQKRVEALEEESASLQESVTEGEERLQQLRASRDETEAALEEARAALSDARESLSATESRFEAFRARMEQVRERARRISEDLADLDTQEADENERLEEARASWQEAMDRMNENADWKESLLSERDDLRTKLDDERQQARHARDHHHQLQLQVQDLKNRKEALEQTLERMKSQQGRLDERIEVQRETRENAKAPIQDLEMELEGLLERRVQEEEKLNEAREALDAIDEQVRDREQRRGQVEQDVQQAREKLEKLRMDTQAIELQARQYLEQLEELEVSRESVQEGLPEDATAEAWQQELTRIGNRIQRLGAINLAAIDEYRVASERKTYLDEQDQDLQEALESLESAIRRIDRETRARFRETFDAINQGLQNLFPRVFGGGSAHLEMTGDDLLETGVAIMARPPGKKNTTIHLLSGGEKALTAIALVFSIFQLNPAPFCMLDEVDAPLDDANVGRYAKMVKEMSEHVQFIYITHNKISMELSNQLMGVTMHEPGVSRLVSVDVEEAAVLADS